MSNWQDYYIAIVITIIALIKIVELFINNFSILMKSSPKPIPKENKYKEVMDDLMNIIHYKCLMANRRILQPLVDKALNSKPLINDKIVNKLSVQITQEVLEEMSEDYKKKLLTIYNPDKLEDIILELVYNTVTEMALEINKKSIRELKFIKTFKSFTKNDIDSE